MQFSNSQVIFLRTRVGSRSCRPAAAVGASGGAFGGQEELAAGGLGIAKLREAGGVEVKGLQEYITRPTRGAVAFGVIDVPPGGTVRMGWAGGMAATGWGGGSPGGDKTGMADAEGAGGALKNGSRMLLPEGGIHKDQLMSLDAASQAETAGWLIDLLDGADPVDQEGADSLSEAMVRGEELRSGKVTGLSLEEFSKGLRHG